MGAALMCAQRFFESPTVCAYILTMLVVGLLLDAIMLRIQDAFPAWSPGQ
jgi:ABC-type nitrate/sulfonate/bicarbonate transport system permease component